MVFPRIKLVIRGGLVAFWLAAAAAGQELDDLNALVPDSLAAMKAEHWEEALGLLTRATAMTPAAALRSFGPQFGVVWYRRGICELKLRRWEEAIHSFETCYRDYPNRDPSGGNLYQTKALLKWGEAAVGAKKWDLAIARFRKFLDERDKVRDTFPQASFHITLGICQYRLGHLAEGNEQLEIAIRNRASFPTSDDQIVAGIQVLVAAAISGGNEQ
ncbi:MAG: tetratricopeptide repeat protein, partial [Verrucomicrobiales bacterium]